MHLPPVLFVLSLALLGCALGKDALEPGETGDEADADDGALDLLFVVDNSSSMQDEVGALASALDGLEAALDDAGVTTWRAGVVTSSVYYDEGATPDIDPGEVGTLIGGSTVETVADLREALLCQAACWDDRMPSDPDYTCGDALEGDEASNVGLDGSDTLVILLSDEGDSSPLPRGASTSR